MNLAPLISKMVIFAVLLTIGYLMARKGILGSEFSKGASTLLVNVFIVASILNSVMSDRPALDSEQLKVAFIATTAAMILTYIVAFVFCRIFIHGDHAGQTEMMMDATNTLFVGVPIASALFGSIATFYIGISCIAFNLLLFTYGTGLLKKEKAFRFKELLSVSVIASITALVLFLVNPPLPSMIKDLMSTVAAATVPVSMIVIGASMGKVNPVKAFGDFRNYLIAIERLVITPLLTWVIFRQFIPDETLLLTCVIIAGVPVGSIATPLSIKYGCDAEYCAKATMVTTVLCMFTLPILLKILT